MKWACFIFFWIFGVEKQRSREAEKLGKSRSREAEEAEEADLAHGPRAISYMRASCMGNHHLQSTEDSPPSALEIHLRIHAMRAYHTVRTIGVIIETCSFSRKRRERKNCSLAQYTSESSVYCTVAQPTPAVEHSAPQTFPCYR